MAMGLLLENMGKQVNYVLPDAPASIFSFLPEIEKYTTDFDYGNYDLCIFLDIADTNRVKHIRKDRPDYFAKQQTIVIDHHVSNPGFGKYNIVDADASSTCELLTEMFQELYPQHMDETIATYLLMGISTDTGNFMYEKDPARTFAAALTLLALGADKELIAHEIYRSNSLEAVQFQAKIIDRISKADKVLYSWYTDTEILAHNLDQE
ncbi:MAG: DHH family phosphoesterase [Candidatus Peribacteria bacterium]|nr:MAG: DHH family phosphoesterase [Candidatus Peribacteria bacterium]